MEPSHMLEGAVPRRTAGVVGRRRAYSPGRSVSTHATGTEAKAPAALIRWAFYAFLVSVPFEEARIGGVLDPTALTLLMLLTAALLHWRVCFRRPPATFWLFAVFIYLAVTITILVAPQSGNAVQPIIKLVQFTYMLPVFLIAFNLFRHEEITITAWTAFGSAVALLAVLQVTGIAAQQVQVGIGVRYTAFGFQPNHLSKILALGALALLGLSYGRPKSVLWLRFFVWPAFAAIALAMVKSGSRGGLVGLAAGFLAFALTPAGNVSYRVRNLVIAIISIVCFAFLTLRSESMQARLESTVENGDLAKREYVFPIAVQMISEQPLIGWGVEYNAQELAKRMPIFSAGWVESKDTHNLALYVTTSTGIVGAVPFFLGMCLCVVAAWKARSGPYRTLPIAMMACLLVATLSASWLQAKILWIILAFAAASGVAVADARTRSGDNSRERARTRAPMDGPNG